jgi:pimeloyl-ACP methyl ester carboxylesterase
LLAERDERIRALATWASVSTFVGRFTEQQVEDWETQGYTEVMNGRTGQVMRLNRSLYDDAMEHRDELDIMAAAKRLDILWLIVHADDDEAVDIRAAERLKAANSGATLLKAKGEHTFGGAHPHDGTVPESLREVWDRTIGFFDAALR